MVSVIEPPGVMHVDDSFASSVMCVGVGVTPGRGDAPVPPPVTPLLAAGAGALDAPPVTPPAEAAADGAVDDPAAWLLAAALAAGPTLSLPVGAAVEPELPPQPARPNTSNAPAAPRTTSRT
jgi:hypothetical protein